MRGIGRAVTETVLPARLGRSFRWLVASSWTTNLGDGIALAAGPLLVASLTGDAFLVALAALLQWLPPLLFGLYAGALADRLDRRRIIMIVDAIRAGVVAVLCVSIAFDRVSISVVLCSLFLVGVAEVFADNTSSTLMPMLVHRDDLPVGNARLITGFITVNQLAGPPLGAALFAVGALWPFLAQALVLSFGVLLISRIRLPPHGQDRVGRVHLRTDIAEGIRWALGHPAVRTLLLTIAIFNVTFGAAWSVLVLYATQRLGLGEVGFGLIATVQAVGGILGTAAYGWITRRLSLGAIMRIGLIIETLTHVALAVTTNAYVAMGIFLIFGAHAFIWGTTSITVRQRAVPQRLQGRVGSVNQVAVFGGLVVGAGVGGLLAQHYGLTAPFWFAFAGSALFLVAIWRQLTHLDHAEPTPIGASADRDFRAPDG